MPTNRTKLSFCLVLLMLLSAKPDATFAHYKQPGTKVLYPFAKKAQRHQHPVVVGKSTTSPVVGRSAFLRELSKCLQSWQHFAGRFRNRTAG